MRGKNHDHLRRGGLMGDHRASIQITFEMHEVKKEIDMWINWCDNGDGIDNRVVEFFRDASEEAMHVYEIKMDKYRIEQYQKQREQNDKIEYERLKKKYEGNS